MKYVKMSFRNCGLRELLFNPVPLSVVEVNLPLHIELCPVIRVYESMADRLLFDCFTDPIETDGL